MGSVRRRDDNSRGKVQNVRGDSSVTSRSSFGLACDGGQLLLGVAFDDGQHVVLFQDEVLLFLQPDLLARILAEQDPVARVDVQGDPPAVVFHLPVAGGDDRALLRLLFGGVRDDDPGDVLFAFVDALNNQAVV